MIKRIYIEDYVDYQGLNMKFISDSYPIGFSLEFYHKSVDEIVDKLSKVLSIIDDDFDGLDKICFETSLYFLSTMKFDNTNVWSLFKEKGVIIVAEDYK